MLADNDSLISCNRAVFGALALHKLGLTEAKQYKLPFDYPRARAYAITHREYAERTSIIAAAREDSVRGGSGGECGGECGGDSRAHSLAKPVTAVAVCGATVAAATLTIEIIPFSFLLPKDAHTREMETAELGQESQQDVEERMRRHGSKGGRVILTTLLQWAGTTDPITGRAWTSLSIIAQ